MAGSGLAEGCVRWMKIGFLFNHEGAHQVAHSAPIAFALSCLQPDFDVGIFHCGGAGEQELRRLARAQPHRCRLTRIEVVAPLSRTLARLFGETLPIARIARLRDNLDLFSALDALVVPEKTSLMLKDRFGLSSLRMVHTRHGAGDRAIGFDKASGRFDFVLVSGPKVRDRLMQAGLIDAGSHAIVGYPKFDLLRDAPAPTPPFDNGRPTVIYNPHPSPALSSWYKMGPAILEYFARSDRFNLIFAPHIMLFRKRWTVSLSPWGIGRTGSIPATIRNAPNILIDTGSRASVDMTHLRNADIYLGDASSQIYEFLVTPRPCIFANPAGHDWQGKSDFTHWRAGPVVDTVDALDKALTASLDKRDSFAAEQRRMFLETFDLQPERSSVRAAEAINAWLRR